MVLLAVMRAVAPPPGLWSWPRRPRSVSGVACAVLRWRHLSTGRALPTAAYVVLGALVVVACA